MTDESKSIRDKLAEELGTTDWAPLAPHAASEKLIIAAADLDLLEAAVAVAENDAGRGTSWIEGGQLAKLSPDEQAALNDGPRTFFQFVVVAPFVLAQQVDLSAPSH